LGIVISTFENILQVIENIKLLRSYENFKKSIIVVVTTSENKEVIERFQKLALGPGMQPLLIEVIRNCPGNSDSKWEPPPFCYDTPTEKDSWRAKFLPVRILRSMEVGFKRLYEMGCKTGLHIHGDMFVTEFFQDTMPEELRILETKLGIWDLCEEDNGIYGPIGVHVHPAPLNLNLTECNRLGILDFGCFYHKEFTHYNWISIESLIGCWANFCLCKQSILKPSDKCSDDFYNSFIVRTKRFYHGNFVHLRTF
jgi:hypothetical protein